MKPANSPGYPRLLLFVLFFEFVFGVVSTSINEEDTVVLSSSLPTEKQAGDNTDPSSRQLALGDFGKLNDIFENAVIRLPDAVIRSGALTVKMRNTRCTKIEVGDILVDHKRESDSKVTFRIDVLGLGMNCFLDYRFERILISGRGSAELRSYNNEASIVAAFTSPVNGNRPPSNAYVESCDNSINIDDMNFDGEDFWSFILDTIEPLLRTTVENEAEKAICEELDSFKTTYNELLQSAQNALAQYPSDFELDPLASETELNLPENVKLLNLQEDQTTLANVLRTALDETVKYLTTESVDVGGSSSIDTDMNVNIMIRDLLLDNGAFAFELADLPFGTDGVIYKGHDKLTQTTISLKSVQLIGLDTLERFDPVAIIGEATLESELAWKYLGFELELLIDIKPSTLDDSVVSQPGSANVVERVKVKFGVNNPSAVASFLLAIDEHKLEMLQIGQLLNIDNILPCIMSTIFAAEISGLKVEFTDMEPPILENFVSPGIDRVVSKSVQAAYLMYKSSLLDAVPNFFHTAMRKILNEEVAAKFMSEVGNSQCPFPDILEAVNGNTDAMNLQDLFLRSDSYGDLLYKVMGVIEDKFLLGDGTSLPAINSVVAAFTKAQSGIEGQYRFQENLFNITTKEIPKPWSYLLDKVEFKAFNTSIQNLDTLTPPLSFLEAIEPNILSNRVNFGSVRFSLGLLLALEGEDSPLNMRNEVELSMIVPSSSFVLDILAEIQPVAFLGFPLGDITNLYCWLATTDPSLIRRRFQEAGRKTLPFALSTFIASLSDIQFDAKCTSCTSPGGQALPIILDVLEDAGVWSTLHLRTESLLEEIAWSYWDRLEIDRLLDEAPLFCPHHSRYNESASPTGFEFSGSPTLSRRAAETVAMFGAIAIEVVLAVTAKSHLLRPANLPTDPLSSQLSLEIPPSKRILDWTALEISFGAWADSALKETRKYIGRVTKDNISSTAKNDLGANILVRNLFLGSDGFFTWTFKDIYFEEMGLRISLDKIEIHGLDSMTKADTFNIIAPQTFKHHVRFQHLSVKAHFNILPLASTLKLFRKDSESLVITFGMENVGLNVSSLIAFDMDLFGEIELGALLEIERIIPCLFSGFHDINIPQLTLSAESIADPKIEGIGSSSVANTTSSLVQSIFDAFSADFSEALPIFFDTTLRRSINGLLRTFRNEQSGGCHSSLRTSGIVDFRELFLSEPMSKTLGGRGNSPYGDLFRSLNDFMNRNFMQTENVDEETSINKFVRYVTEKQSNVTGEIAIMGVVMDANSSLKLGGLEADFQIKLSDLKAKNLDSIGAPIELLQVASEDTLDNMLSFGVGPVPARLSGRLLFVLDDNAGVQLRNEVDLDLSLKSISVFLRILLRVYEEPLFILPIRDFSNLNCWLATAIPKPLPNTSKVMLDHIQASLQEYSISIQNLDLSSSCASCTSPNFDDLIVYLFGKDLRDQVTDQLDQVLGSDFVQVLIDRLLNDAAKSCPQSPLYDSAFVPGEFWSAPSTYLGYEKKARDKRAVYFNVANAIIAFCLTCMVVIAKKMQRQKNKVWIASLTKEDATVLRRLQDMECDKEKALDAMTESMFRSSHIPRHYRYLVPFTMLFTIGLYMGGHLGLLSTIDIEAQLAGETFKINKFLEFAFIKSTAQAYSNGGSELAVLLFLFSGIWPYVKLCTMLALWFLPPSLLSVKRRGDIFLWIDVLARLSVVDLFSVLVVIAAMMIFAGGPDEAMTTENGFYSLKAIVVPQGGFYCLMIAIRVARISQRFFLDYHLKIVALASFEYERQQQIKCSLHSHDIEHCIKKADIASEYFDDEHSDDQSQSVISLQKSFHEQEQEYEDENGYKVYEDELGQLHHGSPYRRISCLGGTLGVVFTLVTVATMIAIACILAPTVAFETKNVLAIALDSRKTLAEVVSEYSVFRLATVVLQKASFVLGSMGDYIGLGVLLVLGIASAIMFPAINAYVAFRRWVAGKKYETKEEAPVENKFITDYIGRFKAYNHLEVHILAFVIAIWQLGAFSVYAVHYYCDVLEALYTTLVYVGMVEETNVQCFALQMSIPANILIIGGGFLVLLFFFLNKAMGQYKKNISTAQRFVGNTARTSIIALDTFEEDEDQMSSHCEAAEENGTEQMSLASLPTEVTSNLKESNVPNTADFLQERSEEYESTEKATFTASSAPMAARFDDVVHIPYDGRNTIKNASRNMTEEHRPQNRSHGKELKSMPGVTAASELKFKVHDDPIIVSTERSSENLIQYLTGSKAKPLQPSSPSIIPRQKLASNNTYGIVNAVDSDEHNSMSNDDLKKEGSFYNSSW